MVITCLIVSVAIVISLFILRDKRVVYSLLGLFLVWQGWFTIQACLHFGTTDAVYFTPMTHWASFFLLL